MSAVNDAHSFQHYFRWTSINCSLDPLEYSLDSFFLPWISLDLPLDPNYLVDTMLD